MKKRLVIGVCVAVLFAFGAIPAMGDSDNSALVIKGGGCGVLNGNGGLSFGEARIQVSTHGGTTTAVCKATGAPNDSGKAVVWTPADFPGLRCGTSAGPTSDWHNTVSASGNVTLVCKVRN